MPSDLRYFFDHRDRVIIFTQYTDNMDYIRDNPAHYVIRLHAIQAAAATVGWRRPDDRPLKNQGCLSRVRIKILLCTESAVINLQTCGVLINYDLPWNPMRVEQRIGRIDRIGRSSKRCGFATISLTGQSRRWCTSDYRTASTGSRMS